MSAAREILLGRLKSFEETTVEPALQNVSINVYGSNDKPRFLRGGLQIMIFCTIEDFLRERTIELFSSAAFQQVRFSDLPPQLQKMLTINSVEAIISRAKSDAYGVSDPVNFCINELKIIGNSTGQAMPYSSYFFGKQKSNLGYDDIDELLMAIGVEKPGESIASIAMRCGYAIASGPKQAFRNFAKNRHSAAHDPRCAIEITDLQESIKFGTAFCLAFDFLATVAIGRLSSPGPKEPVRGGRLQIRVIFNRKAGEWIECQLTGNQRGRTVKKYTDLAVGLNACWERCGEEVVLVQQDISGLPKSWRI